MRFLKLDACDFGLFHFNLDCKKSVYFLKHSSEFKNMFEKQGETFWLRFLLTFQLSVKEYFIENPNEWGLVFELYGEEIVNSVCICIHKFFLETPCNISHKFIENIFKITKKFDSKNQKSINLWENKKTSMFYDSLGNIPEAIEPQAIRLANVLYFGFANGVCILLERWQEISDLDETTIKTIDYTLYYWKPPSLWLEESFPPSCFEKYLATYWKGKLPKMLLTFNVHEVFGSHLMKKNCCSRYVLHEIIFKQSVNNDNKNHSLRVIKIFSPAVLFCKVHSDCFIKIQHDANCLEPYVCLGRTPCLVTCITACKIKPNKNMNRLKNSFVEVFVCKKKRLRDVSTYVESCERQIETFYPLEEDFDNSVSLRMEDFMCLHNDPHFKNSMSQQKRKEDYRKKLRKKLRLKYDYDVHDPLQLKCMYDEAECQWAQELCAESFKNLFKNSSLSCDKKGIFEKTLFGVRRALTSVATGTSDIVFGRVVLSSKEKLSFSQITSNQAKCQSETGNHMKKIKRRKGKESSTNISKTDDTTSNSKSKLTDKLKELPIDCFDKTDFGEESLSKEEIEKVLTIPHCKIHLDADQQASKTNLAEDIEQKATNLDKQSVEPLICPQTSKHSLYEDIQQETKINISNPNQSRDETNVCGVNLQSLKGILCNIGHKTTTVNLSDSIGKNEVNSCQVEKSLTEKKVCESILETKSDNDEELETFYSFVSTNDVKLAASLATDFKSSSLSNGLHGGKKMSDLIIKKSKLKTCAFCLQTETECKTFKRCSKCKAEHLLDQYYYCSRECQVADWEKSHKEMHAKKIKN